MPEIKPFKAIRPTPDKAAFVASRSYEEYSKKELEAKLSYNPFSFLHIINPGFKYDKKVSGNERFRLVRNRYMEFLEDEVFMKDPEPSFYIYRVEKNAYRCTGFFCATSIADYENGIIKKHEATIARREKLFADYLEIVRFEAEPVLMAYKDNASISAILESTTRHTPAYEFTTPDRIKHSLWVISDRKVLQTIQQEFSGMDSLYIADGHHRSASSCLLGKTLKDKNPEHSGKEAYNYFMSYLIPESDIRIFEFNRMVKDLNGLSKKEFLVRLDESFRIKRYGNELYKPGKKHHFSMYLDGEFYSLYLRKRAYNFTDSLSRLDTQILYKTILEPVLGIQDLRNDKRIQYGYGKHNVLKMKDAIDRGDFEVGFGLLPVNIDEIKAIADEGLVMPPKSTYIEPKLRSGLTVYDLSDTLS
ncbi:DUF1015 domain-containing protein [Lentiprolixibacter aurantiacus]|uniref:DUF1015 domain-containing protein n=1 Tax=Lentiprolixibacter aurantiacus TaxID=2993939 RepID=A0AAE3MM43_9FLAO|nr:DUF1015 domain-containing protein [Lentiprolixibacter aurantiacus]MCX2719394.1 DUF1015 domain-containing protein [Lentiprolixibacter aurantiacus]